MPRIVYLDGQYLAESQAKISIFDRGFLFADAVYEVTSVINGGLVDIDAHLARLQRSCHELSLSLPVSIDKLKTIHQQLIAKNQLHEGAIYLQISRGNAGDRDFYFPSSDIKPTLVLFTQSRPIIAHPKAETGLSVVTCPDIRWHRRDIKTVSLLAASMAKEYAHAHQADDALLVENGFITEGTSCNCYMVQADNTVITRPLNHDILHGITRQSLLRLAEHHHIRIEERPFSPQEARHAQEMFITSATSLVLPVISLDGHTIAEGKPGPITRRLREIYIDMAHAQTR
ncbi:MULTISPECIES: D-amino-acid transaminase [Dickeya]|uniref:Aminodeoxychorismate lyase n=1 Tax=Dickeya aquatica TaxID=1401087 RepID=A0A375A8D2_9GAMM|nr:MULTISPECIES: D-amino-acid transaminase [Dickeya]SLM62241.1 D-alanine aminotransferase. Acts on the D-isomers of alanine, leucine, aspartate, glutamate, aminobutyrate, norvaline and asparagine. The enzyme transfers an amino group from a substrate D-amino acid to the pyridoxal phosphate cofactor to form pyridoxamine and an alpha-keto acid in the first half-reaction. The second-half reaction is the reverse of the first, transferring the amino group from the pyridoxamine to a second alpha-keto aci